ncbi:unnamed protein product [Agarophyton chilense]|eukprot:gb/GEZJ01003953.1/.p1 GENE.gb/GEZJ01003953.1/~~gb/GEZJ01003953.1/.p1  ORF type:complete len:645 (+),score=70.55 gb/GEZJ01003953.1/:336-2270(+)
MLQTTFIGISISLLLAAAFPHHANAQEKEPQKVIIESNESWQSGVVLVYSTIILIGLRLSATIRHSPLSPIRNTARIYYYATASLVVGLLSTLILLLLSTFPATRDVAGQLMPCASPLLALGGVLTLMPQVVAPQMDAQPIVSIMGVSRFATFFAAAVLNAMTIAASVLNGAWAATSISLATTLIALFGPRTPVVDNTVANGIVEPGGPVFLRVCQLPPDRVITLSFTPDGKNVREFSGKGWLKLQTDDEFSHDGRVRIGAYPRVRVVVVNEEEMNAPLLDVADFDSVQLISGEDCEKIVGYLPLETWMNSPFGDDVEKIRICMNEFYSMVLGAVVCSACEPGAENDFPGASFVYGRMVRRMLSPVSTPDEAALGLPLGTIGLSTSITDQLGAYEKKIERIEHVTATMTQPHCNIMRIVLMVIWSWFHEVHDERVLILTLDAVARLLHGMCRTDDDCYVKVEELCVVFEGMDDIFYEPGVEVYDKNELHAVVTDKQSRCVHWISRREKQTLEKYIRTKTHAVICSQSQRNELNRDFNDSQSKAYVEAITVERVGEDILRVLNSAVKGEKIRTWSNAERDLTFEEWNESRQRNPQRVWPANWRNDYVEAASVVASVKGMAEIASLQAINSGIAAGSVLFGRLLGA